MTDAIWPPSLNQDVLRPLRRRPPAGAVIASPVEKGPPKARPRYTPGAAPARHDVTVPLDSRAQVATFEAFRDVTLAYGTLAFTWVDQLDGAGVRLRIDPTRFEEVEVTQVGGNTFQAPLPLLVLEYL